MRLKVHDELGEKKSPLVLKGSQHKKLPNFEEIENQELNFLTTWMTYFVLFAFLVWFL